MKYVHDLGQTCGSRTTPLSVVALAIATTLSACTQSQDLGDGAADAAQGAAEDTGSPRPGRDGASPALPDSGEANDAATFDGHSPQPADAGTTYTLYVNNPELDESIGIWTLDVTTQQGFLPCGSESQENGAVPIVWDTTLVAGHSYELDWVLPAQDPMDCNVPISPHYVHAFGPVTGDTTITLSLNDPQAQ